MNKQVISHEAKLQQQKFFRLCSEEDHRKLIKKEYMSLEDFERITFLLRQLELFEYDLPRTLPLIFSFTLLL